MSTTPYVWMAHYAKVDHSDRRTLTAGLEITKEHPVRFSSKGAEPNKSSLRRLQKREE
jgi:hypothetical protein